MFPVSAKTRTNRRTRCKVTNKNISCAFVRFATRMGVSWLDELSDENNTGTHKSRLIQMTLVDFQFFTLKSPIGSFAIPRNVFFCSFNRVHLLYRSIVDFNPPWLRRALSTVQDRRTFFLDCRDDTDSAAIRPLLWYATRATHGVVGN